MAGTDKVGSVEVGIKLGDRGFQQLAIASGQSKFTSRKSNALKIRRDTEHGAGLEAWPRTARRTGSACESPGRQ